jgi:hypothetical protein
MAMEKPTPIECLEQGYPMTMARLMLPEDLTREDAIKLLEGGFPQHIVRQCYNFSGEAFFAKLREWGLNKSHGSWASKDPYRGKRAPKEPVQPIQEVAPQPEEYKATGQLVPDEVFFSDDWQPAISHDTVQDVMGTGVAAQAEERLTAIEWLQQHGTIPDPSEVKVLTSKDWKKDDAAELLKAGATYIQMAAYYGWKGVGSVSYCVKRDGLVGVSANKAFGTKPVKETEDGADRPTLLPPIKITGQPLLDLKDMEGALAVDQICDKADLKDLQQGILAHVDDLVRGRVPWSEPIIGDGSGEALPLIKEEWCPSCGDQLEPDEPGTCEACLESGETLTPISEAVHQAAASGEIKATTVEHPWQGENVKVLDKVQVESVSIMPDGGGIAGKIIELHIEPPAPSIDLASMRWFAPGINSRTQQIRQITFCADGSIRMTTGLLASGPAEHRNPGGKFSARVGINAGTVAIMPDPNGYTFSSAKGGVAKKCSAKAVTETLTCHPVVFEAAWDETQGAYVGRLMESKAGVA